MEGSGVMVQSLARLLVLMLKTTTWGVKTRYWSWSQHNFRTKTSLGLGLDEDLWSRRTLLWCYGGYAKGLFRFSRKGEPWYW